ncbi:leucine-zipper of insertion element IS481 [Jannaschia faecimaris]|uniref:Leucine-zipper of insertion element IS481 n=1 Tax=Jannaschia faecimaris TaxID=1244108 RepID=A0A1H3U6U4_9RHOB|nr:leucine zipper domain-containing protein [Jannaschia faecimaris]SDZ58223.1 leucine-zipper of insertion element IS481 [Jannaschia faecimaris]
MNINQNARLTPLDRERLAKIIEGGASFTQAAVVRGVRAKTAARWYRRFKAEGADGLIDRSSRPESPRNPTPHATCDRTRDEC